VSQALREIWHADAPDRRAAWYPAAFAADGRVAFVTRSGVRRFLVAIDAQSQAVLWTYPWAVEPMLLHEGRLFAWVSDREAHLIDPATGETQRVFACPRPAYAVAVGPWLVGHAVDREYGGAFIFAVDWTSGRRAWTERLPGDVGFAERLCASLNTVCYGQRDGAIVARDLVTGIERWRRTFPERAAAESQRLFHTSIVGTPAVHGNAVVLQVGGTAPARLTALGLDDGATRWSATSESGFLVGDRYYSFEAPDCTVRDAASGATVDVVSPIRLLTPPVYGAALVGASPHYLLFSANDGTLLVVRRETGALIGHHQPASASNIHPPVVAPDGRLYYQNGLTLYALECV